MRIDQHQGHSGGSDGNDVELALICDRNFASVIYVSKSYTCSHTTIFSLSGHRSSLGPFDCIKIKDGTLNRAFAGPENLSWSHERMMTEEWFSYSLRYEVHHLILRDSWNNGLIELKDCDDERNHANNISTCGASIKCSLSGHSSISTPENNWAQSEREREWYRYEVILQ